MSDIIGTESSENLNGTNSADTIDGGGGNDIINSGAGNDTLDGGSGSDSLNGGSGSDTLIYNLSENTGANDLYMGGSGIDTVKLELTVAEWENPIVQQEIREYLQHLATVKANTNTGEVSNGTASDFTFDFGNGTKLTVSMMEKLVVVVNGETIDPHAPYITSGGAGATVTVSVAEDAAAITDVNAFDLDGNALTYEISAGNGGGLFTIDSEGKINVAAGMSLDYETQQQYVLSVNVSDGTGLFDTQQITINVTDVNEAPSAGADQVVGAAEDVSDATVLATVVGSDPDLGGGNDGDNDFENLSYAIQSDASGKFEVDAATGAISLKAGASLDYEAAQSHEVTVRVSDGPGLYDDVAVTINATDVNEAPSAGADQVVGAVEDVSDATVLATVVGSDPDTLADSDAGAANDAFNNLSYVISGGNAAGLFEIDAATGAISLASGQALDYESDQSHTLTVTVADGGGSSDTVDVTIDATDVEENVAPVATGESIVISDNITLIPKEWLLGNDTDADGDALSLSGLPSGMTLDASGNVVVAAGSLPSAGSVFHAATTTQAAYTVYSLSYTVSDGQGGVSTPVTLKLAVVDTGGGADKVDLNGIAADLGGTYSYSSISGQGDNDTLTGMTTTGSSAIDFLVGNGNNDTLNGGTGSDTLTGSGGDDTFVFSTVLGAGNVDAITDFDANPSGGQDHIQLSSTIFTAIGGALESGEFVAWNSDTTPGGPAQDGNNYILFDTFTGNLYYDANATLADGMQLFAKLAVAGTVDSTDFTVGP